MRPFMIGAVFGFGIWLVVRGLFPAPVDLATRLAKFAEPDEELVGSQTVFRSTWGRFALWVLRAVKGELLSETEADIAVTGGDLQSYAIDKVNAATGGAILLPVFGFLFGLASSPLLIAILAVVGAIFFYLAPDIELKRKAQERRDEFDEVLTGFVSIVAVSISGGGGVNSAMADATDIGHGWCFVAIGETLEEAALAGESPWAGLDRLGRRWSLVSLIELAGALSLAGNSGARVSETLQARAESARAKELADVKAEAEAKSESMGVPVAAMLLGWFGFIGYPAVANLLGA